MEEVRGFAEKGESEGEVLIETLCLLVVAGRRSHLLYRDRAEQDRQNDDTTHRERGVILLA